MEREIRYYINDDVIQNIKDNCLLETAEYQTIDIVLGYAGFDSLAQYGYIVRIRDKGSKIYMENKKLLDDKTWMENRIDLPDIKTGTNFLMNMGYKPYLVINRKRSEYKYHNLKLFIDKIDLLGTFVEIEYQDSTIDELDNVIKLLNIKGTKQPLYGDIFKEKMKDSAFAKLFNQELEKYL